MKDVSRRPVSRLSLLGLAILTLGVTTTVGCKAPVEAGEVELMRGGIFSETEIDRVGDLMARDLVRDPVFFKGQEPPKIGFVKVQNDTNQYMFGDVREAYVVRMRTQLKRALRDRVIFINQDVERRLAAQLAAWHIGETRVSELCDDIDEDIEVDYFLTAQFSSLPKVVHVAEGKDKYHTLNIVELLMTFSLINSETAELVWQNDLTTAAAFSRRDFRD